MTAKAIARTRRNVHIHRLYVRHEHDACLALIEEVLAEFDGLCEYPIYVKALVQRRRGRIQESLQLFQAATALNPHNVQNLKQVGRSLYLLGKQAAVEVYEEAEKMAAEKRDDDGKEDWEIHHQKGLCYARSKQFGAAAECFMRANAVVSTRPPTSSSAGCTRRRKTGETPSRRTWKRSSRRRTRRTFWRRLAFCTCASARPTARSSTWTRR